MQVEEELMIQKNIELQQSISIEGMLEADGLQEDSLRVKREIEYSKRVVRTSWETKKME